MANSQKMRKMIIIALFCAMAYATMFVLRIKVSFLTFDAKDAVITVGALYFGPISAIIMSFAVAFIEFITISDTGIYGMIMNFASSAAFAFTVSIVYKYRKSMSGAIFALLSGVAAMTVLMLGANLIITPLYIPKASVEMVMGMIPTLLLPFNLTKALLNAGLVLVIYKPVSLALGKVGYIKSGKVSNYKLDKKTIIAALAGIMVIVISLCVFFFILGGNFELTKTIKNS